jgi:hypothetical protein
MPFEKIQLAEYKHEGKAESDIKSTRTLMHELSRYGPCLARADVNGDGLDDFFVGGESTAPATIFLQGANGHFKRFPLADGKNEPDGYAVFFDADNDGDQDLYSAKASPSATAEAGRHRLYLNDGHGNFSYAADALPEIKTSASCVEAADIDNDGDLDLFVGGRFSAGKYPLSPRSYILRNDRGRFADATEALNAQLVEPGMIASAVWADYNNDKAVDLIVAGEWQSVRVFQNDGDKFNEVTNNVGLMNTNGWWTCIKAADLNKDGFVDFIVGNTGKNSFFKPTLEHPVQVVAKDFDGNGSMDPLITYYNPVERDRFIVHNRLVLIDQIPGIKRRFETFTQYATRPFGKVFTQEELDGAYTASAYRLASVVLVNEQGKGFTLKDLPDIAQVSTINDILVDDVNADGFQDVVAIGNMYGQETLFGRYNASVGTILLGDGNFGWREFPPWESGFVVDGDARFIESIVTQLGRVYAITNYNDSTQFYAAPGETVRIARQVRKRNDESGH